MKTLFLVFYGFQEYNGISKKIRYQTDALRQCGADVRTCHYEVGNDGSRKWMIDEDVLADLGKGIPAKIKKRLSFAPILQYVRREGIQCVYIRSYHNANPFTIHFVRMLKKQGVRVLLEIPTYPYDHEYSSGMEKVQLYTDKLFRHAFCRYVDFIVTFSSDDRIFGRPTIRISNGIDFARIPLRSPRHGITLDTTVQEETSQLYNPDSQAVRSETLRPPSARSRHLTSRLRRADPGSREYAQGTGLRR